MRDAGIGTSDGGELAQLLAKLAAFRDQLEQSFGRTHAFGRISASQSDQAANEMIKDPGRVPAPFLVADLYSYSKHIRQFEASAFVSSVVMRRCIDTILNAHERQDASTLLSQLRSFVERVAHVRYFVDAVSKKLEAPERPSERHPLLAAIDIDNDVVNALQGTTVKWNDIATKELRYVDLKNDIGRGLKEELGVYFATQVLNKIDRLEKLSPGTRASYEILCDFMHPNAGDF